MAPRYQKTHVTKKDGTDIVIYATPRIHEALETITTEMTLYQGVRLTQVIEAAYDQGKKDGAREAFQQVRDGLEVAENAVPHRLPGRPRKKR